jgi:RimJ/RimL family protein N-acetyltransferase
VDDPPVLPVDSDHVLTGWRDVDAATHRRFASDPAAARAFGWDAADADALPDAHYAAVVERFEREWRAGTRWSLALRRVDECAAVGMAEARRDGDAVEVSYLTDAPLRGSGLAPKAVAALLDWVATQGVRRARIECGAANIASRRVAEKCGFVLVREEGDELRFERAL